MPKVRKLARERSIDLATVTGSGPHATITVADLDAAVAPSGGRRERLSAVRRSIARHLTASAQQIPQFTSMVEVDAAALLATRAALARRLDSPVPLDAVLTALLVPVLQDHRIMNAMLEGDEVVYFDRYDIGIAVDAPDGLTVPVVRGADRLPVAQIAAEILRLAAAARDRTIAPAEMTGATATVNNVGALGLIAGTPILPLGTSMIAAFGKARTGGATARGQPGRGADHDHQRHLRPSHRGRRRGGPLPGPAPGSPPGARPRPAHLTPRPPAHPTGAAVGAWER